ncbi:uncharacterized protein LOC121732379 isoform X2 [Aricia agestis]|nr:uncharacterized protein LOC121732379 isoform X2 [Aricia agestis]
MDDQRLHSVKFYRDMYEIFRYNPSQTPPIRLFNVSGVAVQGGECLAASCAVRIMPPPLAGRAAYSCEVSTEGPKFKIARQTKHMTVVAMPEKDPEITGAPKLVSPGEQVVLNCTSAPSLPPAEINWYVDEEQQKTEQWQNTELSEPTSTGLQSSWRVLKLVVPTTASGILRVRCESLLVVEPPVVRDTITTITVHARTQLSKYVSNGGNQQYLQEIIFNLYVFWTFKVTLKFLLNL